MLAHEGSLLEGVECHAWKPSGRFADAFAFGIQALAAARTFRADLVHCFGQTKWLIPWCIAGGYAVVSYGVLPQPRVRGMTRLFRDRLLFAGCSDYISRAGEALVSGRWRTGYNCVDPRGYRFEPEVAPDAPLVFLGRIDPIKGVHVAIEVARKSGRRLIIAGNHTDEGESGRYWRERVHPHLGQPGIEYVGPVDDAQKDALLGQAAALVAPVQWDEPFGMVFIEALACGTPVIACARGAVPEIVREGVEGFFGSTADELAAAVGRIAGIDRHACRRRVEERFSTARTTDTYEMLYRELLGGRPARAA